MHFSSSIFRETNLKVRQSLPETAEMEDDNHQLAAFNAEIVCEAPNNRLAKFEGLLKWNNKTYSLDNDKMLLRGKNTLFSLELSQVLCRVFVKTHKIVFVVDHNTNIHNNNVSSQTF